MHRITYRTAAYGFLIAALWLVLGALLLLSPVPRALDIAWQFFAAWMVLFLLLLAGAGALLTVASLNGLFGPPRRPRAKAMRRTPAPGTLWAPPAGNAQPSRPDARRHG